METVTKVTGFKILDKATGQELATYPLTVPIGSTVESYTESGQDVTWTWVEKEATQ
jgi:hypothetical protein